MCDIVMVRTLEQGIVGRFAKHSGVPVINGLTNENHPCQILGDLFTYMEHRGLIRGRTVAWVGDSNNVCHSWLQAAALLDFKLHVSTPPGYEIEEERVNKNCETFTDPMHAARGADLVTTDVGTSMGFEAEDEERRRAFHDWQVAADMMRAAKKTPLFMHSLPAAPPPAVAPHPVSCPH